MDGQRARERGGQFHSGPRITAFWSPVFRSISSQKIAGLIKLAYWTLDLDSVARNYVCIEPTPIFAPKVHKKHTSDAIK